MLKKSAGILLYKLMEDRLHVFLVHPGGPVWQKRDLQSWSIPKGEYENEDPGDAAKREFQEETGFPVAGDLLRLAPQTLKSGKIVTCFAVKGDIDPTSIKSNLFEMEWPPKSGKIHSFPEVDRGEWFTVSMALQKINPLQAGFIYELMEKLGRNRSK
ncbi:MAG: NUDIX hydrolase [Chloroflexi bacterium RBG_16_48_7]|nr:MAG: NUDIX hydrolase [Chloroflexi bacterium RBG_16_48_7]